MAVLIKIIQLILALSILVIIHEFGHFLASRIFGVRVEKFYMFFDWKFSIFRCKKVNGKWRFKFFRKNEPEKYITHETTNPLTNKKEYTYEKIDLNTLPEDDWRRAEDSTEFGLGWVPLGGYCKIAGMIDDSMDQAQMAQVGVSHKTGMATPHHHDRRRVYERDPRYHHLYRTHRTLR